MPSETPQQQRALNRLQQRCLPWDPAKVLPHNLTATAPVNAEGTAFCTATEIFSPERRS